MKGKNTILFLLVEELTTDKKDEQRYGGNKIGDSMTVLP
jgi:hypothetical protein